MSDCPVCKGLREWLQRAYDGDSQAMDEAYDIDPDSEETIAYQHSADAYLSALQVQAELEKKESSK